jgi:diguanylate cyclase (GGDEF)-like protein/PAS domain S-box-containing protein
MNESLRLSLQYKLGAIVLGVTVIALGLFGILLIEHVEQTEYSEESGQLLEISRGVRGMLAVNHELMTFAAERDFAAFEAMFDAPFALDGTRTMRLAGHEVPQLKMGARSVGPRFQILEAFTEGMVDHVATIFVRHGDDFLRVATSLRDDEGERATGTLLGRDHPASRNLLAGEDYVGKAELFGRPYMAKYRPLVDRSGNVIGALFVGLDLWPSLARIKEEIKAIRVGRTGYVYVLDARPGENYGRLLIHAAHEGRNVFEIADADARESIRRALARGDGTIGRYQFPDRAGVSHERIVAIAESPEWQWLVGVSADYEEFTEQRDRIRYAVLGALLVAALAIILALKLAIRRLILAPLLEMHATLQASETRFRTLVTSSHDLIYTVDAAGRLTAVFDKERLILAAPTEPPVGQAVQALLGADPQHEAAHARALEGRHVVYDWAAHGPSGRVEFQSSLSPMHDESGRVSGLVCIGRDITERRRAEELTAYLARHDALTGLPNRALMQDRLQQAIRQAERNGRVVGLLFIDLDRFKAVNDDHGHDVGDQLLQAVAQRLLGSVRQTDTVARIGGDEFVAVVGDAREQTDLVQVAEKLLDAFAHPFILPTCTLEMSASIGISCYPADATDAAALLKSADAAMYQAKNAGRANFRSTGATS